jgi:hypothetical protein
VVSAALGVQAITSGFLWGLMSGNEEAAAARSPAAEPVRAT